MNMSEDKIWSHFTEHSKMFNSHAYINFVTGFELTNQEFAKFVQPKPLNIRRFEILLGSIYGGYDIPTDLLNKEKEDRFNLFHTLGTVHLMEK